MWKWYRLGDDDIEHPAFLEPVMTSQTMVVASVRCAFHIYYGEIQSHTEILIHPAQTLLIQVAMLIDDYTT